ncbi:hypothetical protein EV368DRAFT_88265 [Lentinula lateritia]|nr:hypothetical protein EV368DRAFT_88265 [Lentinula lateritia]
MIQYSFLFLSLFVASICAAPPEYLSSRESVQHPLVDQLVTIEPECNAAEQKSIRRALSDAYEIAEVAQHIQKTDPAFSNYFVKGDKKFVPAMFESFLSGGGSHKKFPITCVHASSPENHKFCLGGNLAFVETDKDGVEKIFLCPQFFGNPAPPPGYGTTALTLSSKKLTAQGWCTPPPHILGHYTSLGAHTILHEMTHITFIATHALNPPRLPHGFRLVVDLMGQPDELHPGHFYNDWPPALARELKHRWDDYQAAQAKEDFSYKMPPVPTSRNAENYADSGVEYYFEKKCSNFKPADILVKAN